MLRHCQHPHCRGRAGRVGRLCLASQSALVSRVQERAAPDNRNRPALPSARAAQQSLLGKKQVPSFPGHQKVRLRPKENKAKYLKSNSVCHLALLVWFAGGALYGKGGRGAQMQTLKTATCEVGRARRGG